MNDYMKEQNPESSKEKSLVCQPNPHNITPIYPALMDFVAVVETALKCEPGQHCTLYAFLIEYIGQVFLGQIRADNGEKTLLPLLCLDLFEFPTDHLYETRELPNVAQVNISTWQSFRGNSNTFIYISFKC